MSTLTERYVWGVLRAVPEKQRAELEPEVRALVADAVEARLASGATSSSAHAGAIGTAPGAPAADLADAPTAADLADAPTAPGAPAADLAAAERAALTELGDPEVLAGRYTNRSFHLIGPGYFLEWRRLLSLLLAVVVPIVTLATIAAGFIAREPVLEAVTTGVWAGFNVGLQLAFWVTVVFAVIERRGEQVSESLRPAPWTPDRLPSVPSPARMSAGDAVTDVLGSVILIGIILWGAPMIISADDTTTVMSLFNPALATTWAPWFLLVAVLQLAFAVIVYASRRWTLPIAIANAALDAAFVLPAVWLLQTGQLLNPEIRDELDRIGAGAAMEPTVAVISVVFLAIVGWDAIEGFLKVRRGTRVDNAFGPA